MSAYVIFADPGCDLMPEQAKAMNLTMTPMPYRFGDQEFNAAFHTEEEIKTVYARIRLGDVAETSQINPEVFIETFSPTLEAGQDVLCLTLSSGISGTYNSACAAAATLAERYPERTIQVVDSLCASGGFALLCDRVCAYAKAHTLAETVRFAETTRLTVNHCFTVDDLKYLKRSGRLSGLSASLGTLLHIKPVLYVNDEGRLLVREKVPMRKRALRALADAVSDRILHPEGQQLYLTHADCLEEAQMVVDVIKARLPGIAGITVGHIGPIIGAHSGPGTLAVFFLGRNREDAE